MSQSEEPKSFDHVPSAAELLEVYEQSMAQDPSSLYYKRVLIRPKIPVWRTLLCVGLTLAASAGIAFLAYRLSSSLPCAVLSGIGFSVLILLVFLKRVLIWLIRFYQRVAPDRVRNRCRFEPSCSQYMIQCLQKYGLFRGLRRGINRLWRCKPPNGGEDLP